MYECILVPLDGSETSAHALQKANVIALRIHGRTGATFGTQYAAA